MSGQKNKSSSLLTYEENQRIFSLIGNRCQSLCTAVVQLYATSGPNHNQWIFQEMGVLCFVKDNTQKSFFFRMYCLYKNCLLWEHPLYLNIEYNASTVFFHIFEGENCVIAFNFAEPTEAGEFKQIVLQKIIQRNKREERKRAREYGSTTQLQQVPQPLEYTKTFSASTTTLKKDKKKKKPMKEKKNKNKSKKKIILKSDISDPLDFQHLGHVGFDINRGFDLNLKDESLKELFNKAGVSKKDLSDSKTQSFIANFIEENGGMDAIRDFNKFADASPYAYVKAGIPHLPPRPDVSPPPIAKRTDSLGRRGPRPATPPENEYYEITDSRPTPPQVPQRPAARPAPTAPIYKPSQVRHRPTTPTAPIYQTSQKFHPPTAPLYESSQKFSPPAAGPPPPPPPMLQHNPSLPQKPGALLDSIRKGTSLKHVTEAETETIPAEPDSHGQLLDQIRQGKTLKPVNMREVNEEVRPVRNNGNDDLASALAKALQARSKAFQKNESDESSTSSDDDDEWE